MLQSSGNFRAALVAIDAVFALLSPGAPPELRSRALALKGVVCAKLGDTSSALESVRASLSEALVAGHPSTAAAAYQAVAIVYENAGELGKATEAYDIAIDYCEQTGISSTAAVCSACLCHVLRQRGEWRRSLALSRSLLDDPSVDERSPRQ